MNEPQLDIAISKTIKKLVPHPNTFANIGLQQSDTAKTLKCFTKCITKLVKQRDNVKYILSPTSNTNNHPSNDIPQAPDPKRLRLAMPPPADLEVPDIDDILQIHSSPDGGSASSAVSQHRPPTPVSSQSTDIVVTVPTPQVSHHVELSVKRQSS